MISKFLLIVSMGISLNAYSEEKILNLNHVCCPCTQFDCKIAERNCSRVVQSLKIMSTNEVKLTGESRRASDGECSAQYGAYVVEPSVSIEM